MWTTQSQLRSMSSEIQSDKFGKYLRALERQRTTRGLARMWAMYFKILKNIIVNMSRRCISWWANAKQTRCRRCLSRSLCECVLWTRSWALSWLRSTGEQTLERILSWLMCRAFIGCWCFMYERWESGAFFTQTKPPTGETGNMEIYCYENWMRHKIINV